MCSIHWNLNITLKEIDLHSIRLLLHFAYSPNSISQFVNYCFFFQIFSFISNPNINNFREDIFQYKNTLVFGPGICEHLYHTTQGRVSKDP